MLGNELSKRLTTTRRLGEITRGFCGGNKRLCLKENSYEVGAHGRGPQAGLYIKGGTCTKATTKTGGVNTMTRWKGSGCYALK